MSWIASIISFLASLLGIGNKAAAAIQTAHDEKTGAVSQQLSSTSEVLKDVQKSNHAAEVVNTSSTSAIDRMLFDDARSDK